VEFRLFQRQRQDARQPRLVKDEGGLRQTDALVYTLLAKPGIEKPLDATISRVAVFSQQAPLQGILLQQALGNGKIALVTAERADRLAERCQLQIDMLQIERRDDRAVSASPSRHARVHPLP